MRFFEKYPVLGIFCVFENHFLVSSKSLEVNGNKSVLNSPQETHQDWRIDRIGPEFLSLTLLDRPLVKE